MFLSPNKIDAEKSGENGYSNGATNRVLVVASKTLC
jgi:hypothetical protein